MIALTSQIFDLLGYVRLNPDPKSDSITFQRRVSRTATLDGNSALSDMGYSASDNTLKIEITNINKDEITRLELLIKTYPLIIYYDKTGIYKGVIETLITDKLPIKLTFLISEQIA